MWRGTILIVMGAIAIGRNVRIWQHLSPCLGVLILLDVDCWQKG